MAEVEYVRNNEEEIAHQMGITMLNFGEWASFMPTTQILAFEKVGEGNEIIFEHGFPSTNSASQVQGENPTTPQEEESSVQENPQENEGNETPQVDGDDRTVPTRQEPMSSFRSIRISTTISLAWRMPRWTAYDIC